MKKLIIYFHLQFIFVIGILAQNDSIKTIDTNKYIASSSILRLAYEQAINSYQLSLEPNVILSRHSSKNKTSETKFNLGPRYYIRTTLYETNTGIDKLYLNMGMGFKARLRLRNLNKLVIPYVYYSINPSILNFDFSRLENNTFEFHEFGINTKVNTFPNMHLGISIFYTISRTKIFYSDFHNLNGLGIGIYAVINKSRISQTKKKRDPKKKFYE